jgi:chitin disaccharide deacetylase
VNADDFGQSLGINEGIIKAHTTGIVTSASLMVRWPSAREAVDYCNEYEDLSLGLHMDFGEWAYQGDHWVPVYEVVPTDDITVVAEEATRQLSLFRGLTGRDPTHLDSHQHVHRTEPVHSVLAAIADRLGRPLRGYSPYVQYRGDFYGQSGKGEPYHHAITVEALIDVLASLPQGITELGCHPGAGDDLKSMYSQERLEEVGVLCDPRVRDTLSITGIELCTFQDVRTHRS